MRRTTMAETEYDGFLDDEDLGTPYSVRPNVNLPTGLPPEIKSTAELLAKQSMERKIQTGHIVNHHGATQMYINSLSLAKQLGFNDEEKSKIVPFPSPNTSKSINITDHGNAVLATLATRLVDALVDIKKPTPTETPQPETQPGTTQPDTPTPGATDGIDLRVITTEAKPNVPTSTVDPKPNTQPTPQSNGWGSTVWSRLKRYAPWIVAVVALLGGGSYAYYFNQNDAPGEPSAPIKASDIDGRIGVTIE